MARRLEKIEKEMGYCDIKLEKEKRSRKQVEFMKESVAELNHLLKLLKPHDVLIRSGASSNMTEKPSREAFLAAGLVDLVEEKRDLFLRELNDMLGKLNHYNGFDEKKRLLEEEKGAVLQGLSATRATKVRKINEDFKKTERVWNELTEDLLNLDEGLFFLERNLDYLRSARNFLITAKGNYDIENWRRMGYLTDLFRHSNIGRAREMAHGADRNIQSSLKELVCVSNIKNSLFKAKGGISTYVRVLIPFAEALYEDLFVNSQIEVTIQVMEGALASNLKLLGQLKAKKESMSVKLEQTEKIRSQLFQRMGAGRRSELTT